MMKSVKVTFFFIFILSLCGVALAGSVPDTGQTGCTDNSKAISCPETPEEDFYGQDSMYDTDKDDLVYKEGDPEYDPENPDKQKSRFTKLNANGGELEESASSWVTVRDSLTGLVWEVKTNNGNIHDKDNIYTWYDSTLAGYNPEDVSPDPAAGTPGEADAMDDTEEFISSLNENEFGSFSDWRLPTVKELAFIVNRGSHDPASFADYFPYTESKPYWTATTNPKEDYTDPSLKGTGAWAVDFKHGQTSSYLKSSDYSHYHVRAVRGIKTVQGLIDNGDGTVTDVSTGLMWEKDSADAGQMAWQAAIARCETLPLAGKDDWRLPDVNELVSLADYNRYEPAIDTGFTDTLRIIHRGDSGLDTDMKSFPDTKQAAYWSSTYRNKDHLHAWYVNFNGGSVGYLSKTDSAGGYVRAVRDAEGIFNISHVILGLQVLAGMDGEFSFDLGGDGMGVDEIVYILQELTK